MTNNRPGTKISPGCWEGLVPIRRSRRQLHFLECAAEQIFRFLRMTIHVELIRLLRGVNLAYRLLHETLCGGQIRMPVWIYVLPNNYAGSEETQPQNAAQHKPARNHGKILRRQNTDPCRVWQWKYLALDYCM